MARKERWLGAKNKKQRKERRKPLPLMGGQNALKRARANRRRDGQDNVIDKTI